MRISDWSSDVCSSDLSTVWTTVMSIVFGSRPAASKRSFSFTISLANWPLAIIAAGSHPSAHSTMLSTVLGLSSPPTRTVGRLRLYGLGYRDRKTVVSGTNLSISVDLGGRGLHKNNK